MVFGQDHIKLPPSGSVSFVQFFGSSMAPNPHLHMMFLDGVFANGQYGIKFFEHRAMSRESMFDVIQMIYFRLAKLFAKKGFVDGSGEASVPKDFDIDVAMPFRPRVPKAYRRKGRLLANLLFQHPDPEMMSVQGWLNVRYKWSSLHAAVSIAGTNRAGLRQLFHYGARSSVNLSLLSYMNPDLGHLCPTLQNPLIFSQPHGSAFAVNHAVIEGQRGHHHRADDDLVV